MTEDKTKVKDLATELGVPTKNLLQALRELDIPAKSTSSNIAAEDIDRVKNHLKDSATSEQGDRREVQPGVIVRRRRQSTEDVAAEGEEAPRTERRAPRENHTPTARIVSVPGASEAQDAAPVPSAEPEAPAAPEVSVQEPVKEGAEEKPAPVVEADKADDQKPRQPRDNRQKKRSGLREAAPVAKVISRPQDIAAAKAAEGVDYMTNMYIANIGSREKMEEYFNKTSSQIRETLRENAREGLKVQKMQQKLVGEIKITPAEVRRYFKDLPQDSIPYIPTQVEVQIITQQPKVPLEEIEDVKRRLREYTDRVNKGESFSMLARLYSEDRGSAMRGGEIEFSGRGMLDPAYANVAFNLQDPSKVSKIVESEYGFHIIQLIEKRGDRIKTRHILLKPHIPEEALAAGCARLDSIADDIRNNKFSFEEAASVLSQDKDTRNNHGLLPNPNTNTSRFEMQELPPEIAKVVDKMKVGEISEAFTMIPQKTGKEECVIVKLKSRTTGHKATIADDYQNLKEIVLEKRRDEVLDKWIREKQKHTYVRIKDNWKNNCTFKYPGWIKE